MQSWLFSDVGQDGLDFLWCYKCSREFFAKGRPDGPKYGVPGGVTTASGEGCIGVYRGVTGASGCLRAAMRACAARTRARRAQSWASEAKTHTFLAVVSKLEIG